MGRLSFAPAVARRSLGAARRLAAAARGRLYPAPASSDASLPSVASMSSTTTVLLLV